MRKNGSYGNAACGKALVYVFNLYGVSKYISYCGGFLVYGVRDSQVMSLYYVEGLHGYIFVHK